jgi:hypothetical protein
MLPGSTDFFLSFSQTQLVFFRVSADRLWGSFPHVVFKNISQGTQKAQLTWAAGAGGMACCTDKDLCLAKHCLPLGGAHVYQQTAMLTRGSCTFCVLLGNPR